MAQNKFDGIVEAVRYKPDGWIDFVRVYERRGPTYSDSLIIDRKSLIEQIKKGKKFSAGKRLSYLASTFEITHPIRLVGASEQEMLVTSQLAGEKDNLQGVPLL